jgi:hypothetical protein
MTNLSGALPQALTKPVKTITGLYLAKATRKYPAWRRAKDAVGWLKGEVVIVPTAKLACSVFSVSYPRLKQAQAQLDRNKHHGNGNGAPALSDEVVERIVAEVGVERIWRVVEKLTQPQLPLQAAEAVS